MGFFVTPIYIRISLMTLEKSDRKEKELSPAERISQADTWEELENALRSAGSITGSKEQEILIEGKRIRAKRAYSSGELIEKIKKVRNQELFLSGITKQHGLREKVSRLLIRDADSLEELKQRLIQMGKDVDFGSTEKTIKNGVYWVEMVGKVEKGSLELDNITRQFGLRQKVIELMGK